jgi:phage terminase large subunit GpA-like protein
MCPHCRESITQADYWPVVPMDGAWVASDGQARYGRDRIWRWRSPPCLPPKTLGLHVWTGYSPQRAWSDIVQEFENALKKLEAGDVEPMKLFVNETLGETWELKGDRTDEHALQARAEPYPWGWCARCLTSLAGVDVQRTWWQITIWAWGAAWRVGPSRGSASTAIRQWMRTGSRSPPSCCSGFSKPARGPAWASAQPALTPRPDACRLQLGAQQPGPHPNLRAIKGDDNKPIVGPSSLQEVNHRGMKVQRGIKLYLVGVDQAKDRCSASWRLQSQGRAMCTSAQISRASSMSSSPQSSEC